MSSNPSKLSNPEREKRMLAMLAKGESIETLDDMSDEYYEHLTNLMLQQADSELAGDRTAPRYDRRQIRSRVRRNGVRLHLAGDVDGRIGRVREHAERVIPDPTFNEVVVRDVLGLS